MLTSHIEDFFNLWLLIKGKIYHVPSILSFLRRKKESPALLLSDYPFLTDDTKVRAFFNLH